MSTRKKAGRKQILTLRELVEEIGLSESTWRREIQEGRLRHLRLRGRLLVRRRDVESYLKERTRLGLANQ